MIASSTSRAASAEPDAEPHGPKPHRARLSPSWARFVNQLSRRRSPYDGRIADLPLRLGIDRVCLDAARSGPGDVEVRFALEGGGRIGLELPAPALDQIARAVQPDLDLLPSGPTGTLLLELALAPLLDAAEAALGRGVRVESVGPPDGVPGRAALVLAASLAGREIAARVHLGSPAAPPGRDEAVLLRLAEAAPASPGSLDRLPVALAFVMGSVRLARSDLAGLVPGDAILPDVWHPERGELAVILGGRLSTHAAVDRWRTRLKAPFRPVGDMPATVRANAREGMAMAESGNAGGGDAPDLDALDVTLTFELARRSVAFGELKGIGAGHVFDLGLDPGEAIDLRVDGVRIGRGEIVEVGDRLGVRVVRLFGGGPSA